MGDQRGDRLFLCDRCGALVSICSTCDRGNRYCSEECSRDSRRENCRRANGRYRRSERGRRNQRRRQKAYRARQAQRGSCGEHRSSDEQPGSGQLEETVVFDETISAGSSLVEAAVTHQSGDAASIDTQRISEVGAWSETVSGAPVTGTVTHQGSAMGVRDVILAPDRLGISSLPDSLSSVASPAKPRWTCCVCGRPVSTYTRYPYLSGEDPG